MAGGRVATRTSYKEADSDDDWLASDEEGATKVFEDLPLVKGAKGKAGGAKASKRVGDTYGAGPRKKAKKSKGKGKVKAKEDEDESLFSLDLLFRLPNDLFLEICGYLDGRDLLEFSRTCKTMRKTLFSPNSGYIWANSRRRDDIPLPAGMTELELAALLYSNGCQICGNTTFYFRRQIKLRFRSCAKCRKKYVIHASSCGRAWPNLHYSALFCVAGDDGDRDPPETPVVMNNDEFLIAEVQQVNSELLELKEMDELASFAAERSGRRTSGTKRSPMKLPNLVDAYCAEKKAEVKAKQQESAALLQAFKAKQKRDSEEAERLTLARDEVAKTYAEELKSKYGWTTSEADWYTRHSWWSPKMKNAPPQKAPSASEQAWTVYRDYVQTQVEREARSEERSATWRRHYKALSPFYQDYRRTTTRDHAFLPSPIAFAGNVRKTWLGPDDPSFDADLWSARLPEIERKLDIYERELRVTAIRAILNATSSIPFADLSTDPADYPDAKYDDDFFQKPTSLFVGRAGGLFGPFYAVAYPDCLRMFRDQPYKCPESILLDSINERQVLFLRMILDAADIDESMATIRDLGTMGARFKWTNAPSVRKQARLYSWDDLLFYLNRRGPSLKRLKAGDLPEIEFVRVAAGDDEKRDSEEDGSGDDDNPDSNSNADADADDSDSEARPSSRRALPPQQRRGHRGRRGRRG